MDALYYNCPFLLPVTPPQCSSNHFQWCLIKWLTASDISKSSWHDAGKRLTLHKFGCLPTAYCTSVLLVSASGVVLSGIQLLSHENIGIRLNIGVGGKPNVVSISHRPDTRYQLNPSLVTSPTLIKICRAFFAECIMILDFLHCH